MPIITTCLSAGEETLAIATRHAHEAPPLPDQATRSDKPEQDADIHSRDPHPYPDYGTLLDLEEQARARIEER